MHDNKIKKVLILGSGALKIGEAGEFDYSGSQALKALKEEGIYTLLINPTSLPYKPARARLTASTFCPSRLSSWRKSFAKERPDGIMLAFGGQTALNCGVELYKSGGA